MDVLLYFLWLYLPLLKTIFWLSLTKNLNISQNFYFEGSYIQVYDIFIVLKNYILRFSSIIHQIHLMRGYESCAYTHPQHLLTLSTSKCKIIKIKFQPREAEPSRSTPHLSRAVLYSSTPSWISEASQSVASLEDGCSKHQSSVDIKQQHASIWNLIESYEKLWSNSEKLKQWWHLLKSDML